MDNGDKGTPTGVKREQEQRRRGARTNEIRGTITMMTGLIFERMEWGRQGNHQGIRNTRERGTRLNGRRGFMKVWLGSE
jgi:hypothetical protein